MYAIETRSTSISDPDPFNPLPEYHKLLAWSPLATSLHLEDFVLNSQDQSRLRSLALCMSNKGRTTLQHIGSMKEDLVCDTASNALYASETNRKALVEHRQQNNHNEGMVAHQHQSGEGKEREMGGSLYVLFLNHCKPLAIGISR